MNENVNATGQANTSAAESGDIMQHIQDMVGDLLQNAVSKMHKTDTQEQLGGSQPGTGGDAEIPVQMNLAEIKTFIDVMQKFIDNVSVMVLQLETGSTEQGVDDKFLDGYMATADNILEMAAFSMKDTLTGLSNKYGFDNRLILEWNRATRDKSALGLVIFAIDGIDKCEDKNEHDDLMKAISDTLENSIKRTTDFIARWSEDEFAALLPITEEIGVSIVAERIRVEIGNMDFPGKSNDEKTSVSIGVCAQTPEPAEKPVDFINKAFNAYKEAKKEEGSAIIFA